MKVFTSLAAVLAGLTGAILMSFAGDALVRLLTPARLLQDQSNHPLLLTFSLAVVFCSGTGGAALTFFLAPARAMLLVAVLGCISFLMSASAALMLWDRAPAWYHITILLLVFPAAWLGAQLARRFSRDTQQTSSPTTL